MKEITVTDLVVGIHTKRFGAKLRRFLRETYFIPFDIKPVGKPNSKVRDWKKQFYVFTKSDFVKIKLFDLPFDMINADLELSADGKYLKFFPKDFFITDYKFTIVQYNDEVET